MRVLFIIAFISIFVNGSAQFAPQAGLLGSTALHKDSNLFVAWGESPIIYRGWIHSLDTLQGKATHGDSLSGAGSPDKNVVSLGDGGTATYYFSNPIIDKPGPDFAIFENGFLNPMDSNQAYLELAFVEVSSNGVDFVRFHSESHLDTNVQINGVGDYIDCRKINNLAGKYISDYGTPFDLNELALYSNLEIDNIKYVRIRDVIGSNLPFLSTRDFAQRTINDPFPTNFPTGGFDLDAIGVIHHKYPVSVEHTKQTEKLLSLYPNPSNETLHIKTENIHLIELYSLQGQKVLTVSQANIYSIDISNLPASSYLVIAYSDDMIYNTILLKR